MLHGGSTNAEADQIVRLLNDKEARNTAYEALRKAEPNAEGQINLALKLWGTLGGKDRESFSRSGKQNIDAHLQGLPELPLDPAFKARQEANRPKGVPMPSSKAGSQVDLAVRRVALVHKALLSLGYDVPVAEIRARRLGPGTVIAVRDLASRQEGWSSLALDKDVEAALKDAVADTEDLARVGGRIIFEHGLPAAGITVLAYSRRFGGKDDLLVEGTTHPDGTYALAYPRPKRPVNLEIRTLDRGKKEVSLSEPMLGAGIDEMLNLVAPESVQPLAPEYERLAADVKRALGASSRLRKAKESDGQRDLGIAAEATGWDARLLALAATAGEPLREDESPSGWALRVAPCGTAR